MTRLRQLLVRSLSRLLTPAARDVVLGDLSELNLGTLRTVWELCGLIARQQAPLWKDWRPWLALFGIAGLVGAPLAVAAAGLIASIARQIWTYQRYGSLYHSGLTSTEECIVWLSLAAGVVLWSWAAGFAFVSLARKTAVVTGIFFGAVWFGLNGLVLGRMAFVIPWAAALLIVPSVFFFLPAALGARRALRPSDLAFRSGLLLLVVSVSAIALVTWTSGWPQAGLERWSEGAIHGGMHWYRRLFPYLLLSWPTAWIMARTFRETNNETT